MSDGEILRADDYRHSPDICDGRAFQRWPHIGYNAIAVLPELCGLPWDDIALGYVHALRPSRIRVIPHRGMEQLDCRLWRVTVRLDSDGKIAEISQEVEVGLPEGCPHGLGLRWGLTDGLERARVWWVEAEKSPRFSIHVGPPEGAAPAPAASPAPVVDVPAFITAKLHDIIREQFGFADVPPTSRFIQDLGADSLDAVELVMACEEMFELDIEDEAAEKVETVADAVALLTRLHTEQHPKGESNGT